MNFQKIEREVRNVLQAKGALWTNEIVEIVGAPENQVEFVLQTMTLEGKLEKLNDVLEVNA